jgi:glycogen debranching enzyme
MLTIRGERYEICATPALPTLRMLFSGMRDGAWSWLIGPFIDAWVWVYPEDRAGARHFLQGLVPHLGEAGLGTICEIFDAEAPFTPRGCIAQAWSVAEMLRCWVKTAA